MDRRAVLVMLVSLAGPLAVAEPNGLATIQDLDIEVRAADSGTVWRLPQLLQRRGVLVAIEGGSRSAAAWLAHELPKLRPGQLEHLVVLLVDRRRTSPPFQAEVVQQEGVRMFRTTGAQWPHRAVGIELPQIFGFGDDGMLKSRLVGVAPDRPGIVDVMTVLDL